jgi:hypothetical protein
VLFEPPSSPRKILKVLNFNNFCKSEVAWQSLFNYQFSWEQKWNNTHLPKGIQIQTHILCR